MASKYLQKYPIPDKFPAILEDFTKEVLRDQPDNIEAYSFYYFKALEEVFSYFNFRASRLFGRRKGKKFLHQKIEFLQHKWQALENIAMNMF